MGDKNKAIRDIYETIEESSNSTVHICEALVTAVRKRDKRVKLTTLPDLEEIGWVRLYMIGLGASFHSGTIPPVDSTVLVVFPKGQRESAICLAGGMAEAGEIGAELVHEEDIMFADRFGNKIHMQSGKITIDGAQVVVNGGILPVARQTDTVASPFGNLPIVGGNSDFLA